MKTYNEFITEANNLLVTESRAGLKAYKAGQQLTITADIDYDDITDVIKVKGFGFANNVKHGKVQWDSIEAMMKDVPDELKSEVMNGKYSKFQEYLVKNKKLPAAMGSLRMFGDLKGKQVSITDLGGAMGMTYAKGDTQKKMGRVSKIS